MINSIKGNTISKAYAKKKINELNEIKKVEIKGKSRIENQKKLLSLFDDFKTIFNVNENESVNLNERESVNESENESENENESVNENQNESVNENENENKSDDGQYYLEKINNNFKEINEIKSFKDQINTLKKYQT